MLKPGGRLLIVEFEPPENRLYKAGMSLFIGQMTEIENDYLIPLLEGAGFSQVTLNPSSSNLTLSVIGQKPGD